MLCPEEISWFLVGKKTIDFTACWPFKALGLVWSMCVVWTFLASTPWSWIEVAILTSETFVLICIWLGASWAHRTVMLFISANSSIWTLGALKCSTICDTLDGYPCDWDLSLWLLHKLIVVFCSINHIPELVDWTSVNLWLARELNDMGPRGQEIPEFLSNLLWIAFLISLISGYLEHLYSIEEDQEALLLSQVLGEVADP